MYKVVLLTTKLFEDSENTLYFNNRGVQTNFFNTAFGTLNWIENVNFARHNDVETTIYLNGNYTGLLESNYLIRSDELNNYRYYFARCYQDSGNRLRIDLTLDDIQSNLVAKNYDIKDCIIKRAHTDRFIKERVGNLYRFNFNLDSYFLTNQEIPTQPKYLYSNSTPKIIFESDDEVNNIINNVWGNWLYIFYTGDMNLGTSNLTENTKVKVNVLANSGFDIGYKILAIPTLENITVTMTDGTVGGVIDGVNTFNRLLELNNDNANILAVKVSKTPPLLYDGIKEISFTTPNNILVSSITGTIDYKISTQTEFNTVLKRVGVEGRQNDFVFFIKEIQSSYLMRKPSIKYNISRLKKYDLNSIQLKSNDKELEPMMFSNAFTNITISDGYNNFDYPINYIGYNEIEFDINNIPTPDIQRTNIKLRVNTSEPENVYYKDNKTLSGLNSQVDNGLSYSKNNLDVFLSNNKNFFMQRNLNTFVDITKQIPNLLSTPVNALQATIDITANRINSNYNLDNMRTAPEQIIGNNGNVLLNQMTTDLSFLVQEYKALDKIENKYLMFFQRYGYKIDEVKNIKDFLGRRNSFVFVSLSLEDINYKLSQLEYERLKSKLNNGVRFWNQNNFDYNIQNYEVNL